MVETHNRLQEYPGRQMSLWTAGIGKELAPSSWKLVHRRPTRTDSHMQPRPIGVAMAKRAKLSDILAAEVAIRSRRRCCLCVFLDQDNRRRKGQIAHINHDPTDNSIENLVFLCFDHHDEYDGRTSISRNIGEIEVRQYRDRLYQQNEGRSRQSSATGSSEHSSPRVRGKPLEVEPFFWLAQTLVAWSMSRMELAFEVFHTQAASLSVAVAREQFGEEDPLAEAAVLIHEELTERHGDEAAAVFAVGVLVALLPFSFDSADDLRRGKATIERIVLGALGSDSLVETTGFLKGVPCEIPAFVEKVAKFKESLHKAVNG